MLRVLLTVATFAIVWLVAAPARAFVGAPLCDPHGASAVAPPSQLQSPDVSLDVDDTRSCAEVEIEARRGLPSRHSTLEEASSPREPALAPVLPALLEPSCVTELVLRAHARGEHPGFADRLDRPPRL